MPTYEYECDDCQDRFERRQGFDEEPISVCPKCKGRARRVIHSVPIIFKGSGFYVTDHRQSGDSAKPSRKRSTPAPSSTDAGGDTAEPSAPVKSESKG